MNEFRPCDYCGEKSVVIVNSKSACAEHVATAMSAAFAPVRAALRDHTNGSQA